MVSVARLHPFERAASVRPSRQLDVTASAATHAYTVASLFWGPCSTLRRADKLAQRVQFNKGWNRLECNGFTTKKYEENP